MSAEQNRGLVRNFVEEVWNMRSIASPTVRL
jgi:hypothetical protein